MANEFSKSELDQDIKNAQKSVRHAKEVLRRLLAKKKVKSRGSEVTEANED